MPMEMVLYSLKTFLSMHFFKNRWADLYRARYISQLVVEGLLYMHQNLRMAHNDIKTENILIFKTDKKFYDFIPKIENSGSATVSENGEPIMNRGLQGMKSTCAPECLFSANVPYNAYKADVFSFGLLLYEMVSGHIAYSPEREFLKAAPELRDPLTDKWISYQSWTKQILEKQKLDYEYLRNLLLNIPVLPELRELIKTTMDPNPSLRISLAEVLIHPFTNGFTISEYATFGYDAVNFDYTEQGYEISPSSRRNYLGFGPRLKSAPSKFRFRSMSIPDIQRYSAEQN
jgi:serine/threonine protein kinase